MTKLIAAGCSNTAQGKKEGIHPAGQRYNSRGIITWPQIVAEKMGWDFVNLAVGGCDNTFIENLLNQISSKSDLNIVDKVEKIRCFPIFVLVEV